jgi:hypothetical protein
MTTASLDLVHVEKTAEWHDDAGYFASGSGRIACATLAFALLAAAGFALFGTAANLPLVVPVITLVCIVGGFLAMGLAIDRYGTLALAYVFSLPPVAGLYFAALHVLCSAGIVAAASLTALALVPVTLLVRAKAAG